mmetsp:Transcript_1996/g.3034  ORF Transcript_1996/g.3034 Transcript_1996/m.3034 type:complete len:115 (+) Transcript_1996:1450-1794(+)
MIMGKTLSVLVSVLVEPLLPGGDFDGLSEATSEGGGVKVGELVTLGLKVGNAVVGLVVGDGLGFLDGAFDGDAVGDFDGGAVGDAVGPFVGVEVGAGVSTSVNRALAARGFNSG